MNDAAPSAERSQQCGKIFSSVCERLNRMSDGATPEEHRQDLMARLAHGRRTHIDELAMRGVTYQKILLEMSRRMEAYVARYRQDSRFESKQRHVSAFYARVTEHVSSLVVHGEVDPRTAAVFLAAWPSLSSIGDYSAIVRSGTHSVESDLRMRSQAFLGEVDKVAASYSGSATQQIDDFLHVNARLGRQVTSRIYVSARLDGTPERVIAAWRCALQRTRLQHEVYFKVAAWLSPRFETIVVFQTAETVDTHTERLVREFLKNCPPELLDEIDAPTVVRLQRGVSIAPEPTTINTFARYAGGRSRISYNQLIAAVSELAFELALDGARRDEAGRRTLARLAAPAATYFEQMIKLSDINPDTMAAPLRGGQWPSWTKAL